MKYYGIDFSIKYIIFEDDQNAYAISFKEDIFGNCKVLDFSKGNKGDICLPMKKIKVRTTRPNIFERIRYLIVLTKHEVKKLFKNRKYS